MADDPIILPSTIVKPLFEPKPDEVLVGSACQGLVKIYASKERVLMMFADPKDPGNPQKRRGLRFRRGDARDVATLLREASLRVTSQ